jgi:hypothetical protein
MSAADVVAVSISGIVCASVTWISPAELVCSTSANAACAAASAASAPTSCVGTVSVQTISSGIGDSAPIVFTYTKGTVFAIFDLNRCFHPSLIECKNSLSTR